MRLGVIVCPACKQVKGVDLSSKTTKCTRCGKSLQLSKLKILYETESQEKLRQAIGVMNAKIDKKPVTDKKFFFNKHQTK